MLAFKNINNLRNNYLSIFMLLRWHHIPTHMYGSILQIYQRNQNIFMSIGHPEVIS